MPRSGDWTPRVITGPITAGARVVLVAGDGRRVLRLNDTARAIVELCDGTTTLDEMVDACLALFDVSEDQARREVCTVLEELVRAGAVT